MTMSRKPTPRHAAIAEIANHLGAKVDPMDVAIVFEATRVEYENRTNRPAAGGRAKHDPDVWEGLLR